MSFIPQVITPAYAEIKTRIDYSSLNGLKYPEDRKKIARLPLAHLQVWYAAQDPHTLIEAGGDFHSFWYWHYILPLKLKRIVFKLKFW